MRWPQTSLRTWIVFFCLIAMMLFPSPAFSSTDFVVPPGRSTYPYSIVVGPDSNLWFAEVSGEKIGRITTGGVTTEFPITGAQALTGITSGPDGNLWFTDQLTGKVGHISTSGTGVTQFALPAGSFPQGIAAGPDGNLWFVEQKQSGFFAIGKMTVAGVLTEYTTTVNVGTYQFASGTYASITSGPDGNLWFVNPQNSIDFQIGSIMTSGTINYYNTLDLPLGITSGPDGNLWAIESAHVAKITPSGIETEYNLKHFGSPGITTGPDGNIWFGENARFGMVTPGGVVTEYPTLYPTAHYLTGMTAGPDGALWFVGYLSQNIGRFTTSGVVTNYYALTFGSTPAFVTLGPDGNIWGTSPGTNGVGYITPSGVVTSFQVPTPNAGPFSITSGPDGNLWFLEINLGQLAKVTTSGVVTEYPDASVSASQGLTAAPDGNIWFTAPSTTTGPSIGRITPAGVITVFSLPVGSSPQFITAGPDGNLWFTDTGLNEIGKMDTSGNLLAEYRVPTSNANFSVITTGPDGNLWFLENTEFGAVAKITTSGVVTEYPAQLQNYQDGIVSGPDGAIWFAQGYPNSVARITTSGVVSTVPLTTPNALGNAIAVGSDSKLWIAEAFAGAVGRLSAIGGTGKNIVAIFGIPFNGSVASFVDGTKTATRANFTATINWGDGATSTGTVNGATGGPFTVKGKHTYASPGMFQMSVMLTDNVDHSTYTSSPGNVAVVK